MNLFNSIPVGHVEKEEVSTSTPLEVLVAGLIIKLT